MMKDWDSLLEISSQKEEKIQKILKPLKDYFDIDALGYFKTSPKGQFSYLTNRPETMREYIKNGLVAKDPFYRHPNFYQNQLIVLDSTLLHHEALDGEVRDFISHEAGYRGGLFYLNVSSSGVEGYEFGYHADSARIYQFFQDKILFEAFLSFFKKEMQDLIHLAERSSVSLMEEMGELFLRPPTVMTTLEENHKREFLKAIGLANTEFMTLHLTPRELDCIALYLQRKTAPETGKILHLSTRTVENHFENIKQKLNCHHKSEIYEKMKQIVAQGYYLPQLGRFFGSLNS